MPGICQHEGLLSVLKDEWSWPGFVVPDFIFAVRDDVAAARAGLDIGALDGPGRRTVEDFTSGRIPADRLDDMVSRILYGMFAGGLFDHPLPPAPDPAPSAPEHVELARRVATEAVVLLVNRDGVLPLSPRIRSIAVGGTAGENALYMIGGSGSVELTRERTVTPLAGLRERAGADVSVRFVEGSLGDALRNLERYVQDQQLSNPRGGTGDFGPAIQFDTMGVDFGRWILRFKAQVERNWFPLIPQAAMSMSGHTVLTFNVHKNGTITDLAVVQPSRIDGFNNAAYGAMVSSNPTIPLPSEYPADKAFFTVTFFYNESPR